ncbi:hypothetical protein D3C72_1581980 [compost metagenome]
MPSRLVLVMFSNGWALLLPEKALTLRAARPGSLKSPNSAVPTCPFRSRPWPSWVLTWSLMASARRPMAFRLESRVS